MVADRLRTLLNILDNCAKVTFELTLLFLTCYWKSDTKMGLLVSGCAGHPEGLKNPRELTDTEKDRVVEIALNTPEALRQLETEKVALVQQSPAKKGPQAVTLEDKKWVLESYGEQGNLQAVLEGTEITAIFDSSQGQVQGTAGCNTYFADYMVNNNLSILQIAYTEMYCLEPEGVMEQEQEYLKILQSAESYEIEGGRLRITCGAEVLVFGTGDE